MSEKQQLSSLGSTTGFLGGLQRIGNKLPDPFMLFTSFAIIVLFVSYLCAKMDLSVIYMMPQKDGSLKEVTVIAQNLLSVKFFHSILKDFTKIYITFLPLGMTIIFVMGIGYMQSLGFFDAFMKRCLSNVPPVMVTFMVALIGINGNIASSGGVVMATTLGAAIFASLGRNPMLGGIVGYVSSHGGFTANFMISGEDVLCATVTKAVCESMGIDAVANPLMNYYFIASMTLILAGVVTFVTEVIMPKFMNTEGANVLDSNDKLTISEAEHKGLKWALFATIIYFALLVAGILPPNGILRNPQTGTILPSSPFLDGIIAIIFNIWEYCCV